MRNFFSVLVTSLSSADNLCSLDSDQAQKNVEWDLKGNHPGIIPVKFGENTPTGLGDVQVNLLTDARTTKLILSLYDSGDCIAILLNDLVLVFNVPPTAKVIWRRGHCLKSHPTDL